MAKRVIVVGAGIAGLAAAYSLQKRGFEVLIIEKEPTSGGRMRSDSINGFIVDTGAQFLTSKYKNSLTLIEELGMIRQLVPVSGSGAIFQKGKIIESKYSFLHLMFRFKGLSFFTKLKMGKLRLETLRKRSLLDFHTIEKSAPLDDESLSDYILREIGESALEYYIQPMVCYHPERASKAFFLTLASIAPLELCTLEFGNGSLAQKLAAGLNVIYNSQVSEINCNEKGLPTLKILRNNNEDILRADAVVLAIPASQVLSIAKGFPKEVSNFLEKVEYEPYVVASFAIQEKISPSICELNVPRKESKSIKSIALEHNKSPSRVPNGKGLITINAIGESARRLMKQGKEEAIESIIQELELIYPGIKDNIIFTRIYYHPYGEPQFYPGYIRHLKEFKEEWTKAGPIFFAGDYLAGPFVETALTSGLEAARNIILSLA